MRPTKCSRIISSCSLSHYWRQSPVRHAVNTTNNSFQRIQLKQHCAPRWSWHDGYTNASVLLICDYKSKTLHSPPTSTSSKRHLIAIFKKERFHGHSTATCDERHVSATYKKLCGYSVVSPTPQSSGNQCKRYRDNLKSL